MGPFNLNFIHDRIFAEKNTIARRIYFFSLGFILCVTAFGLIFQRTDLIVCGLISSTFALIPLFLKRKNNYDRECIIMGFGFFPLIAASPSLIGPIYLMPIGVLSMILIASYIVESSRTMRWFILLAVLSLAIYWVQIVMLPFESFWLLHLIDAFLGIFTSFLSYLTLASYHRNIHQYRVGIESSHDLLQQILNANPHIIFAKDLDLRYQYVNKTATDRLFAKPEDFLGFQREEIAIFAGKQDPLGNSEQEVLDSGIPQHIPRCILTDPLGKKRWFDFSQTPLYDDEGGVSGILTVATDRTEEVLKEADLARSVALYRDIFENSPVALGIYDSGFIKIGNQRLSELTGYGEREILLTDLLDEEVAAQIDLATDQGQIREVTSKDSHTHLYSYDGETKYVQIRIVPISNSTNVESLIAITDVTAVIKQKEDLAHLVSELEAIFESTGEGMLVSDLQGNIRKYNQRYFDLLVFDEFDKNLSLDERLKRHLTYRAPELKKFKQRIKEIHENKAHPSHDVIEYRDGTVLERSSYPQRIGDEIVGRVFTFKDITRQRYNERALKENEQKYRTLFEQTPMGLFLLDFTADQMSMQCNSRMETLFKVPKGKLSSSHMLEYSPEYQPDGELSKVKFERLFDELLKEMDTKFFEWRYVDAKGVYFDCETTLVPLHLGEKVLILGIIQDITDRKRQENIIRQQVNDLNLQNQQLTGYSYVVSHNFRSSVANIMGLANAFEIHESEEHVNQQIIQMLYKVASRLDDSVRDLQQILDVQGVTESHFESIHIQEIIWKAEAELQKEVRRTQAKLCVNLPQPLYLMGLSSYFQSVFFNLLSNAIKYKHPDRNPHIQISHQIKGDRIWIFVQDNGLGIDTEKFEGQIFSLYKRFHDHVKGKGLGLFLVKAQIEAMGGRIELESQVNEGSIFKLDFPYQFREGEDASRTQVKALVHAERRG
ncbi:MAG: PAS domain S-box protein [Bacteroidota bacterium]